MRIEIFGLPGVGKTYILSTLVERHPEMMPYFLKYRLSSSWRERGTDISYFARHPRLLFAIAFEPQRAELILRFKRVARRRAHIARCDNCILDDSGTIQPLLEAYILSRGPMMRADWESLFRDAVMGHCYFFISDSVENAVKREINRPARRFRLGEEELKVKYSKCKGLLDRIKRDMDIHEFRVADYGSTAELADNMHKVMSRVLRRLQ